MIHPATQKQLREQFDAKHGGNPIQRDGWMLFPDGAAREAGTALGVWADPPEDPWECAKRVTKYHEERLRRAVHEFQEAKHHLEQLAKASQRMGYPPPDDTELEKLRALQDTVIDRRADLETARQAQEAAKPERLRRAEEGAARNQAESQKLLASLEEIKI